MPLIIFSSFNSREIHYNAKKYGREIWEYLSTIKATKTHSFILLQVLQNPIRKKQFNF